MRLPEELKYLCMFKWAFNIKPDLVIVLPGQPPLVVEAKLEGREAQYPATASERKIFDTKFGPAQGRVNQFELQRFMFEHLIQNPCRSIVLKRDSFRAGDDFVMTWKEVFASLNTGKSVPFVARFISDNLFVT